MNSQSSKTTYFSFIRDFSPLLACLAIYLGLKSTCFHWYISDEGIYYYMAHDLGWSYLPYRDFFYANPPILLLLLKAGGLLTGWSVAGMRAIPILCHVLSGFAFFRILTPHLRYWTVIPLSIYWFSYDSLRASTHATGISETLAFIGLAFLFAFRQRPALSGLCLALGLWTKTYAVTGIPGLVVILWLGEGDRSKRFRDGGWFLGTVVFMLVLLAMTGTLVGGKAFWDMNVTYHLSKEPSASGIIPVFGQVGIRNQGSLYILTATVLLWLLSWYPAGNRQASPSRQVKSSPLVTEPTSLMKHEWRFITVGAVHFLTVLVFLVMQGRIFDFYLLLFLPALALLSGGFMGLALDRWRNPLIMEARPKVKKVVWIFYCLLFLVCIAHPMIPRQYRLFMRQPVTYWQHEERSADELAKWNEILRGDDAVMAGDSGTAPMIALMAGKHLALGEADTNQMRFQCGLPPATVFIQELKDAGIQWLIVRGRRTPKGRFLPGGMFSLPEFKDYAQEEFGQVDRLILEEDTEVRLMRVQKGLLEPDPAVK